MPVGNINDEMEYTRKIKSKILSWGSDLVGAVG